MPTDVGRVHEDLCDTRHHARVHQLQQPQRQRGHRAGHAYAEGRAALASGTDQRSRAGARGDPWIDWYVSTGEPLDKAGAYGVQGAAALFVQGLKGSWSNVVGLPLERLPALFRAAGYDLLEFLHH